MSISRYLPALALLTLLAACSDKKIPTPAVKLDTASSVKPDASKDALMQAVFGAQYRAATKDVLTDLPTLEDRNQVHAFLVTPLATTKLPNGDMVLVAQSAYPAGIEQEDAHENDGHHYVSVYVLHEAAGKWNVLKRHPNIVVRGRDDRPGSVLFPMLSKNKPGLAIVSEFADEGCSQDALHLFDLGQDELLDLADIPTQLVENRGCGGSEEQAEQATNGTWHLAPSNNAGALYDDLVIMFSDVVTPYSTGDGKQAKSETRKKYSARYGFDGKHYKLISGTNSLQK